MPLYEFICKDCNQRFSELCRLQWEGSVKCPKCAGTKMEKAISQFCSPGADGGTGGSAGCGSCSSKNCGSCH
ncbi:MAG: zinc ribbon domain-containing protein [Negativicutes bacterium]|nr:zinc ribbon domain-containing protein [Negativicutes bacterium]